jgi:hypothetical protein
VNNELECLWKEAAIAYFETRYRNLIWAGELKKSKKSFSKNIRFQGRDLNPRLLEREAVMLFAPPQLSAEFV